MLPGICGYKLVSIVRFSVICMELSYKSDLCLDVEDRGVDDQVNMYMPRHVTSFELSFSKLSEINY
jgi:hypothetical protein